MDILQIEEIWTAKQAQEELEIEKYSTLRQYIETAQKSGREFRKGGDGGWRFSREDMEALKLIQQLRELDNRTHASIVRIVSVAPQITQLPAGSVDAAGVQQEGRTATAGAPQTHGMPTAQVDLAPLVDAIERLLEAQDRDGGTPDAGALAEALGASLAPKIVAALQAQNELAEKYARAAHQIGKLEAKNEELMAKLEAERQKALALTSAQQRPWWKLWSGPRT